MEKIIYFDYMVACCPPSYYLNEKSRFIYFDSDSKLIKYNIHDMVLNKWSEPLNLSDASKIINVFTKTAYNIIHCSYNFHCANTVRLAVFAVNDEEIEATYVDKKEYPKWFIKE